MQKIFDIIPAYPVNMLLDLVSDFDITKYQPYIVTFSKETETLHKKSVQQLSFCPDADKYLTELYGKDYIQVPPEAKRGVDLEFKKQ